CLVAIVGVVLVTNVSNVLPLTTRLWHQLDVSHRMRFCPEPCLSSHCRTAFMKNNGHADCECKHISSRCSSACEPALRPQIAGNLASFVNATNLTLMWQAGFGNRRYNFTEKPLGQLAAWQEQVRRRSRWSSEEWELEVARSLEVNVEEGMVMVALANS